MKSKHYSLKILLLLTFLFLNRFASAEQLEPLKYQNPGLVVDLGVGLWAWPMPMDYDGDGDNDLIVSCPDKPYNGTYFFENASGDVKFPVFKKAVRIGPGFHNIQSSYVDGKPHVLLPGREYRDFLNKQMSSPVNLSVAHRFFGPSVKPRANQWRYLDYDADEKQDLIVGVGDWKQYGWDDAYNHQGVWTNGPLHGHVYFIRNKGTNKKPEYEKPIKIQADGKPVDLFGNPSPSFADWDQDGDLDLICGEFLDRFTYFENVGTRSKPVFKKGEFLKFKDQTLKMDLEMIQPVAFDWDKDGDMDLIVGDEDGRVAFLECVGGKTGSQPQFLPPRYFQQEADWLKCGALATPVGFDWDGDGDEDIICGNTAGYIAFFENLGMVNGLPKWAAPKNLDTWGKTLRILAGPNGSIQGPCEAKWGYTTLSVGDWNHDDLPDLIVNSIWGKIVWYQNIGTKTKPKLAKSQPITVEWEGKTPKPDWFWWNPEGKNLVTQWRTTPLIFDWNKDGMNDLIVLDTEGYLSFFERKLKREKLVLLPGKRIFVDEKGNPIQLNPRRAGKSGRRKIAIIDWDGDGRNDLLLNSINSDLLRNLGEKDGKVVLKNLGPLNSRKVSGHSSSPATIYFDQDGVRDLIVGAEDGHIYYLKNHRQLPLSKK
jgi:hypothetical protein